MVSGAGYTELLVVVDAASRGGGRPQHKSLEELLVPRAASRLLSHCLAVGAADSITVSSLGGHGTFGTITKHLLDRVAVRARPNPGSLADAPAV